jgi:membrane fusion protein (multidrug efflux system)
MPQTLETEFRRTTSETLTRPTVRREDQGGLRRRLGRRFVPTMVGLVLIILATVAGLHFFAQSESYQSTDDAFIDGHIIQVGPKISGRIEHVYVDDNQDVKKGDLLVEIDPRDYDAQLSQRLAALDSIKAQTGAAQASMDQAMANVRNLEATVEQNKADVEASQAQADQAADDLHRYEGLSAQKAISAQDLTHAQDSNRAAQASLNSAKKKVSAAEAQVVAGQAQVRTYAALLQYVLAQVKENEASVDTAKLNSSYTKIFAPESGRLTRKAIEPGAYVQTGQTMLALVPSNVWVTANFKENQLRLMRPNQPVNIAIDPLSGKEFRGHVDSIQAGSGARFSLLPPENATGNYVKVIQRVPVKIVFDEQPDTSLRLGPGESVVPTVRVQDFHYSLFDLSVVLATGVALALLLIWWGSRPPKPKKS